MQLLWAGRPPLSSRRWATAAALLALPLFAGQPDFGNRIRIDRSPGSLIFTNNSGHEIQSFVLTETRRTDDGRLVYGLVRKGRGAQANPPGIKILPGGSRVVTAEPGVVGVTLLGMDLDSVVLDDGLVLGPDRYGVVEEYSEEVHALEAKIQLAEKLAQDGGVAETISRLDAASRMEIPRLDLANPSPERQAGVEIRTSSILRDLLKTRRPADAADYLRRYVKRLKTISLHR